MAGTAIYKHKSDTFNYVNTGAQINKGQVIVIGDRVAVAANRIKATTGIGPVYIEGVFDFPVGTGVTFAVGDFVYWDVADSEANGDNLNPMIGSVVKDKATNDVLVSVKLEPCVKTVTEINDGAVTDAKLATDNKIGSLTDLDTSENGDIVGAINEIAAKVATHQANTTAADLAALKTDFNTLLGKLQTAGLMAGS